MQEEYYFGTITLRNIPFNEVNDAVNHCNTYFAQKIKIKKHNDYLDVAIDLSNLASTLYYLGCSFGIFIQKDYLSKENINRDISFEFDRLLEEEKIEINIPNTEFFFTAIEILNQLKSCSIRFYDYTVYNNPSLLLSGWVYTGDLTEMLLLGIYLHKCFM